MIAETALSAYRIDVPSFGENVRAIRERHGLTQEQVAERLGLKRPTPVSLLEGYRGARVPRPATITKVAAALNVEPWELLEGVETDIDRLRNRRDLLRHSDRVESPDEEKLAEVRRSQVGTESATSGVEPPSRKAPDVEARLREENEQFRRVIDTLSAALVHLGAPEAPAVDSVAPKKPRRRRRNRKRA